MRGITAVVVEKMIYAPILVPVIVSGDLVKTANVRARVRKNPAFRENDAMFIFAI